MENKKYEEALIEFNNIFDSRFASDWYTKGNILFNLKKLEEAVNCYNEVLLRDTHYVKAWYRKGWILFEKMNYEDALKCFDNVEILEKDKRGKYPNEDWYICGILSKILTYIEKGDDDFIDDFINEVNKIFPFLATAVIIRINGKEYEFENDFILANNDLEKLIEMFIERGDRMLEVFEPIISKKIFYKNKR